MHLVAEWAGINTIDGLAALLERSAQPTLPPVFHRLHLQTKQFGAETFIVVEIQLFAEYGGATNYVIVGRAK